MKKCKICNKSYSIEHFFLRMGCRHTYCNKCRKAKLKENNDRIKQLKTKLW